MNYNEFQELERKLFSLNCALEVALTESEGEVTDTIGIKMQVADELKAAMTTDGADFLGRWLKAKEDKLKALKAEKDYVARQIKAVEESIDFVKDEAAMALHLAGIDKLKGNLGYSFTPYTKTDTSVNKDLLKEKYGKLVADALREVIPAYVTVSLGASVSAVPEGEQLPEIFEQSQKETCKVLKPRASKEA